MSLFGNNNPTRDSLNVNTGIVTFYSDISCLSIGGWNDKISLRWSPVLGKDANGLTKYDKEHYAMTGLSFANAAALYARYVKHLKDKIDKREDPGEGSNVAVPIRSKDGSVTVVVIEYKCDENGAPGVYLTLGKNAGPNGVAADNRISYKFNDIEMMDDMNLDTGACTEVKEFGEFDNFIEILRSRMTMTGLGAHATRYSNALGNKFSKNRNNGNAPAVGDNMSAPIPDFLSVPNDSMDELPFA